MTHLTDPDHPTVALFMHEQEAHIAAIAAERMYPDTVLYCDVKNRGQHGWQVIAHKTDGSSAPMETSDLERLTK